MVCLLTLIANEVYAGMGLGTVSLIMVMVDAGTDDIIITIIEIQLRVIQGKAPGGTVGAEVHLEVEAQDVIPQVMSMKVAEVQVVAVEQDVILPVPPAEAAALVAAVGQEETRMVRSSRRAGLQITGNLLVFF